MTSPHTSLMSVISKNVGIFERIFAFERRVTFFPVGRQFLVAWEGLLHSEF